MSTTYWLNSQLHTSNVIGTVSSTLTVDSNEQVFGNIVIPKSGRGLLYGGGIIIGNSTTTSSSSNSISIGKGASTSSSVLSTAVGNAARSTGANSVSVGANSTANNSYSTAIGVNSTASGINSIAIGGTATSANAIAIGFQSSCSNTNNIAIGTGAGSTPSGTDNIAIGTRALSNNFGNSGLIGIGTDALRYCDSIQNTAVGHLSQKFTGKNYYSTGTAAILVSGTITGSGTVWRPEMRGGLLVFANGVQAPLTTYVSTSSFTTTYVGTVSSQSYILYYGTNLSGGTVSQSGNIVTGVGTNFNAACVGAYLIYATPQTFSTVRIIGFTSTTSITVAESQTVSPGTSYNIYFVIAQANTSFGFRALQYNTTGSSNTAIGLGTLTSNRVGQFNVALGVSDLVNNTTGNCNTSLGSNSLTANRIGSFNTAVGWSCLTNKQNSASNIAIGARNLGSLTGDCFYNCAIGTDVCTYVTTGNSNVCIGESAAYNLSTGSNNVFIGKLAGCDVGSRSNSIAIGNGIIATQDNGCFIKHRGPAAFSSTKAGFIPSTNELVEDSSSIKTKDNIRTLEDTSEAFDKLRPVRYVPKIINGLLPSEIRENIGLISEEVNELYPEVVTYDRDNHPMGIMYERLVSVLIQQVQSQKQEIKDLKQSLSELKKLLN